MNEFVKKKLVRAMGIEPTSQAWEARVLPLNDARIRGERILWNGFCFVKKIVAVTSKNKKIEKCAEKCLPSSQRIYYTAVVVRV